MNDKDLYEDFQEYNDIGDDLIGKDKLRQFYENKKVINQTDLVTSYHPRGFLLATISANST